MRKENWKWFVKTLVELKAAKAIEEFEFKVNEYHGPHELRTSVLRVWDPGSSYPIDDKDHRIGGEFAVAYEGPEGDFDTLFTVDRDKDVINWNWEFHNDEPSHYLLDLKRDVIEAFTAAGFQIT